MLDYTEQEYQAVQQVLNERYKMLVEIHLADCEVQPNKERNERVERPAMFWNALDCNFVIIKMAEDEFQGFFFYQPDEHFASAQQTYSNAVNCVIAIFNLRQTSSVSLKDICPVQPLPKLIETYYIPCTMRNDD